MNQNIKTLPPVGGKGGESFAIFAEGEPKAIKVRSGAYIDALQICYTNLIGKEDVTLKAGGQGGSEKLFTMEAGEYIVKISGRYGNYIDSLTFETNLGQKQTFGGHGGHTSFTFTIAKDMSFIGFTGKSGAYIDALGICCIPASALTHGTKI